MDATSNQRSSWFGIASCAIALVMLVVIGKTTTFNFEGLFGEDNTSVSAGLTSDLDEWVWLLLGSLLVGIALAVAGLRWAGEQQWVAWTGLSLNALLVLMIVVFLTFAYSQGGLR